MRRDRHAVEATDVVIVLPGKKFYYKGNLKQVCDTAPAREAEHEHHVRDVELQPQLPATRSRNDTPPTPLI